MPDRKFTAKVNRLPGRLTAGFGQNGQKWMYTAMIRPCCRVWWQRWICRCHRRTALSWCRPTAVVNGTEQVFVVRVTPDHKAEWVNVRLGRSEGGRMEVYSDSLRDGDLLVKTASEETRNGMTIHPGQPVASAKPAVQAGH